MDDFSLSRSASLCYTSLQRFSFGLGCTLLDNYGNSVDGHGDDDDDGDDGDDGDG